MVFETITIITGDSQKEYQNMKSAAKAIGISQSTMSLKLKNGGGEFVAFCNGIPCRVVRDVQKSQTIDDSIVSRILEMYDSDEFFYSQIASELGISKCTVRHIVSKKRKGGN